MDSICTLAARINPRGDPNNPFREAIPDLAERLQHAPRYLLDRHATEAMVELSLGRPKVLLEALAHIRVPYSRMWIEWDDSDRQRLRDRIGESGGDTELRRALQPLPGRVGFLLETERGGRAGTATWVWTTPDGFAPDFPSIGPIQPYFDLDSHFPLPPERRQGLLIGNLAKLWLDNPTQLEAMLGIWCTAQHQPSNWGVRYFAELGNAPEIIQLSYSDVVGEYIALWAIMLLLTASRPTVDYQAIDRGKLNKARLKRREAPLLDHTQVTMHIDRHRVSATQRAPLGYQRKSPRIHMVSRYLARRGNKHWLVEPYMRGAGKPVDRHVSVRS
jgi:hypothetical protein